MKEIRRKCWFARDPLRFDNKHNGDPTQQRIFATKPEPMKLLCKEIVQSGTVLNVAELVNLKKGECKKFEIIIRELK